MTKEMRKAEEQVQNIEASLKVSNDLSRSVKKEELEPQHRLSNTEIQKKPEIYLKPERTLNDAQKFNEKWAAEWEFQKEYVNIIAQHNELIGEVIEMWTHPFGGKGASFWKVPTNKPIWVPRFVAEQIKRKSYIRQVTGENVENTTSLGSNMRYWNNVVSETSVQRLDAHPVAAKKSIFMGSGGF